MIPDDNRHAAAQQLQVVSRDLDTPAARALAEAQARRDAIPKSAEPQEINGRGGLEPVRYGDWEVKGLTSDF